MHLLYFSSKLTHYLSLISNAFFLSSATVVISCIDEGKSYFSQDDCLVDKDLLDPYYRECIRFALKEKIQRLGLENAVSYFNQLIYVNDQFKMCQQDPSYRNQNAVACLSMQPLLQILDQGKQSFRLINGELDPVEVLEEAGSHQAPFNQAIEDLMLQVLQYIDSETACYLFLA